MKISIVFLIFPLLISCQRTNYIKNHSYDSLIFKINSVLDKSNFNGIVLLTKDSVPIYSKSIGYSDLEKKIPIKLNDQFVIGSISKQITAVLVLREYEKGTIQLDDKIGKYLHEINQLWSDKVTIHHLLTHTHGIVNLNKPLEFEQGTQFHYSQLGYRLLALILENATGKSFNELSTKLFTEYGLSNTYHPDNKNYKNLVKGYEENNGKLEYVTNSLENYAAAGSFISNIKDLNKWNILLYSGRLVRDTTLQLMKKRYATRIHPIFDKVEYGYGLLFKDEESNIQIGALGYAPGFISSCYYYPQTNINLIVLGNTAKNLDHFKITFQVPIELMELIKKETNQ